MCHCDGGVGVARLRRIEDAADVSS
jgi:hypothetical protein